MYKAVFTSTQGQMLFDMGRTCVELRGRETIGNSKISAAGAALTSLAQITFSEEPFIFFSDTEMAPFVTVLETTGVVLMFFVVFFCSSQTAALRRLATPDEFVDASCQSVQSCLRVCHCVAHQFVFQYLGSWYEIIATYSSHPHFSLSHTCCLYGHSL
jgi:hypothetical protein